MTAGGRFPSPGGVCERKLVQVEKKHCLIRICSRVKQEKQLRGGGSWRRDGGGVGEVPSLGGFCRQEVPLYAWGVRVRTEISWRKKEQQQTSKCAIDPVFVMVWWVPSGLGGNDLSGSREEGTT